MSVGAGTGCLDHRIVPRPMSTGCRRAAAHLKRAAGRDLSKAMALVLLMFGLLVLLERCT